MSIDTQIGRLGKQSASEIADRAAILIVEAPKSRAVCLSPEGVVTIESVAHVIEDDLVGVYTADAGRFSLWKLIYADLREAIALRGIVPRAAARRRVTGSRKVKAEAA